MRFPDAYTIGRRLESGLAVLVAILLPGAIMAVFAITSFYSHENQSQHGSVQAANKFVYTVETDFPRNRVSVLYALRDMRVAYEQTGEGDPARLGQLMRLEDWLVRSHTAGEEQLFLTEVRSHGKVAAHALPFGSESDVVLSILGACAAGFLFIGAVYKILCQMDPRLRPSRAIGN